MLISGWKFKKIGGSMHHFCYASKSTSEKQHLLEDLTTILSEARNFNYKHQISGVLYYSSGYFFQYLEGELSILNLLLEKLHKDPRHHNIKVFQIKPIEQPLFPDWSMQYISRNHQIHQLCHSLGFDKFNPHDFEQHHVDHLLQSLVKIESSAQAVQ